MVYGTYNFTVMKKEMKSGKNFLIKNMQCRDDTGHWIQKERNQIQDMAMFTGYKRKEIKSGLTSAWHHSNPYISSC